jgi:hypothetical protein
MLSDSELLANLAHYEEIYNSSSFDLRITLLCSKSSILEVCGWVEQAMDLLVTESASRCGLSNSRITWIQDNYIKRNYGFAYKKHFEKMITSVVGYAMLEKAEMNAGGAFITMVGVLNTLTPLRNHYAHTHFELMCPYPKNLTVVPAPSTMKSHAANTFAGLKALEDQLILLNC